MLKDVTEGAVTVTPPGIELGRVTAMVWLPESVILFGFTVTWTGVGPLCKLQERLAGEGVTERDAPLATVVVTVSTASATPPAVKAKVGVALFVTPEHPFGSDTV